MSTSIKKDDDLLRAVELQKTLPGLEVGIFVGLRLRGEGAIGSPEINQGLHGIQLLGLEHVKSSGGEDKVAEAAVQMLVEADVVEWVGEVSPVQMRVNAEHLSENGLAHFVEVRWEATALANPVTVAGELRQRSAEAGGSGWDRDVGARSVETARGVRGANDVWRARAVSVRYTGGISGEDVDIVDLA